LPKDIHTEAGAARYITQMTRAIRSQAALKPSKVAVMAPVTGAGKPASKAPRKQAGVGGLSLAAEGKPSPSRAKASATRTGKATIKKKGKKNSKRKKS
jgi:hypothetical protein